MKTTCLSTRSGLERRGRLANASSERLGKPARAREYYGASRVSRGYSSRGGVLGHRGVGRCRWCRRGDGRGAGAAAGGRRGTSGGRDAVASPAVGPDAGVVAECAVAGGVPVACPHCGMPVERVVVGNSWIGAGGTKAPRIRPCANGRRSRPRPSGRSCGPGTFRVCCALGVCAANLLRRRLPRQQRGHFRTGTRLAAPRGTPRRKERVRGSGPAEEPWPEASAHDDDGEIRAENDVERTVPAQARVDDKLFTARARYTRGRAARSRSWRASRLSGSRSRCSTTRMTRARRR